METKRVETSIPFSGFYETHHDMKISEAVESAFNYNHETDEDCELPNEFWDADIDWGRIQQDYCREYVAAFAEHFNLDLQFVEMTSPREYNFTTDRIFVSIPEEQMNKIKDKVLGSEEGRKYVSEKFTSGPGFSSFYSNDLTDEEWTGELDYNQNGAILEFYVQQEIDEENWYEFEYELTGDLELYGWESVEAAQNEVDKAIKAGKIKAAIDSISKAVDWMRDEYKGDHNMPSFAYESVQELQHAVKILEDYNENI